MHQVMHCYSLLLIWNLLLGMQCSNALYKKARDKVQTVARRDRIGVCHVIEPLLFMQFWYLLVICLLFLVQHCHATYLFLLPEMLFIRCDVGRWNIFPFKELLSCSGNWNNWVFLSAVWDQYCSPSPHHLQHCSVPVDMWICRPYLSDRARLTAQGLPHIPYVTVYADLMVIDKSVKGAGRSFFIHSICGANKGQCNGVVRAISSGFQDNVMFICLLGTCQAAIFECLATCFDALKNNRVMFWFLIFCCLLWILDFCVH